MGDRANFAVIKNDDWQLYYDHWCAVRLDTELLWGPDLATQYVEQRPPVSKASGWLDSTWCDGGAVIDHERKVLLWFGGDDVCVDPVLRSVHAELLATIWSPWEVRWAHRGSLDLAAYVGVRPDEPRNEDCPEVQLLVDREAVEHNQTAVSVVDAEGIRALRMSGGVEALATGEAQLARLLAFPRTKSVQFAEFPEDGFHLDIERKRLWFWTSEPSPIDSERLANVWPGWVVQNLGDDFAEHLRLADGVLEWPVADRDTLRQNLLRTLRARPHFEGENPAATIAAKIRATLNPSTFETRASVGTIDQKRHIIDRLELHFGPPL